MDISKLLGNLASDASSVLNSADSLINELAHNVIGNDVHSVPSLFAESPIKWASGGLTNIDQLIANLSNTGHIRTDGHLPGPGNGRSSIFCKTQLNVPFLHQNPNGCGSASVAMSLK